MESMELKKEENVYILTLTNSETGNGLRQKTLEEYNSVFDEIENAKEDCALVVTSSDPKSWCTGIDLEWIQTQPSDYFPEFVELLDNFFIRLALLPFPTIACITGHVFAGGAIMSACFDFRFMRSDKGWFCLPEVNINLPFTPIMQQAIQLYPNRQALTDLALTGKRIGGQEAADKQFVDGAFPEDQLFPQALELAKTLAKKNVDTYSKIKRGLREHLTLFMPKDI